MQYSNNNNNTQMRNCSTAVHSGKMRIKWGLKICKFYNQIIQAKKVEDTPAEYSTEKKNLLIYYRQVDKCYCKLMPFLCPTHIT